MAVKDLLKKIIFNASSAMTDLLYLRPYRPGKVVETDASGAKLLHLDLVITERCSLNCRDCSNLMQYYKSPENLTAAGITDDLKILLGSIRVGELKILGGEPFMNTSQLTDVTRFLSEYHTDRVECINIITNGTIVPDEDCIKVLAGDPRVMISFSNYGKLSARQDEFITVCDQNKIRYCVIDESFYWLDFGQLTEYSEPDLFVEHQYAKCYNRKNCTTLYKGRIFACPRQAHGISLGVIPDIKDEYMDLHDPQYDTAEKIAHAVIGFTERKKPLSACRYCIAGKYIHIPRAVQKKSEV